MAITLVSNGVLKSGFSVNGNSADLSGCETLVAAVAGKSICLERLAISFGAAINVTIGAGETTGAVTTVLVGPIYGAENSTVELVFERPIKLAAATALTADASGAGNVTIVADGFVL
jgi:hypothetical protein